MSKFIRSDKVANRSSNEHLESIVTRRYSRRDVLYEGSQLAMISLMGGGGLIACSDDGDDSAISDDAGSDELSLGFASVGHMYKEDRVKVPEGYSAQVLIPWGTPLNNMAPAWNEELEMTPEIQLNSVGMHHDGMYGFSLSEATASTEFILAVNHEYIDSDALWKWNPEEHDGEDFEHAVDGGFADTRNADQVRTEINAHGVTLAHVRKNAQNQWALVPNSLYNRRLTSATPMSLSVPVGGTDYVKTKYSPEGLLTRGTNSNCGCGFTPWGTYLSCEENWPDFFRMSGDEYLHNDDKRLLVGQEHSKDGHSRGKYRWYAAATDPKDDDGEFSRWYPYGTIKTDENGPLSSDPTGDFRNEPRTFGYVVEIDPYTNARAIKRTHLGRIRHETCWLGKLVAGQPLVFYTGHDMMSEYFYRFVSAKTWDPADANRPGEQYDRLGIGSQYLDKGTLQVAKFNDNGTGEWRTLAPDSMLPGSAETLAQRLKLDADDLAGVIINTCDAADLMEATPLDRTEWGVVDPDSGRVYISCTNNWKRRAESEPISGTNGGADAAELGIGPDIVHPDAVSPRYYSDGADEGKTPEGNEAGHIITLRDDGLDDDQVGANDFTWDIFVFGAGAKDPSSNWSGLTDLNDFAQPDGLHYDDRGDGKGILWILTDNSYNPVEDVTNNQILAVVPAPLEKNDAANPSAPIVNPGNQENLKRFVVAPTGCEVSGLFLTPDKTSLFFNVQHPGNWPSTSGQDATVALPDTVRPRSAVVVVQKDDDSEVGV